MSNYTKLFEQSLPLKMRPLLGLVRDAAADPKKNASRLYSEFRSVLFDLKWSQE